MTTNGKGFLTAAFAEAIGTGRAYRAWLAFLMTGIVIGAFGYRAQLEGGLYVTHMTDQISWGAYIANFTFLVGVAAAAVMVVIPAYAFRLRSFKHIVFVGETLALSAVIMCLLFVTVDIGRPDHAWHLIPWIGSLNFPASILGWDVVVLSGYLLINLTLVSIALNAQFHGKKKAAIYVPLVFVSMAWAVSIHTVTAFLYTWLGARPFWNSAIVAPRFLASAFVSGPALLVLVLRVLKRGLGVHVEDEVFLTFRRIMSVTLLINLFLFAAEVFTELFGASLHAASMRYLLFGREGQHDMTVFVWLAIVLDVGATLVLLTPLRNHPRAFDAACVAAFVGVWIEKGMALVIPGFLPTPLGEMVAYFPSIVELAVIVGVWSFGLMMFTILVRIAARVEDGTLRAEGAPSGPRDSMAPP